MVAGLSGLCANRRSVQAARRRSGAGFATIQEFGMENVDYHGLLNQ
jgi:hypothetical protein